MTAPSGVPEPGFVLSVDLGTSNTVAIVRWPDGRTRPLLFDGAPIMPSGVYSHESGQLVVGRDATRLAGLDPARFEPNPKRRIDEPRILLGDREYELPDLLAALLTAVGRAAVEAVGFLPPAVLTCPAAWGPTRRAVLIEAARRAGWPPPQVVPEPVAAARYFADVLRRPVPLGACLAVFDFGGGTLDVAVVRNDGRRPGQPSFTVLGSGGVENLGGLDVDAAIVAHLGGLIAPSDEQVWREIVNPTTVGARRARKLFWEDVRGAKEMLSRATVAPIAVPGREEALHLTREELDRVAQPLLRRSVFVTADVIQRCGLQPAQLAGMFLVGGSSRLPLVARMLHAELGVAPTVLEQPELPVAEGALAEIAPPASAPGAPAEPAAPTAVLPGTMPGPTSPAPPTQAMPSGAPAGPPRRPWYRRKRVFAAVGAGAVAIALLAGAGYWYVNRPEKVDFAGKLERLNGATISYPSASGGSSYYGGDRFTATLGNQAYVGYLTDQSGDDTLDVGALDLSSGKVAWPLTRLSVAAYKWIGLYAVPGAVVAVAEASSDKPGAVVVLDAKTGKQRWTKPLEYDESVSFFESRIVLTSPKKGEVSGLSLTDGAQKWTVKDPTEGGRTDDTVTVAPVAADALTAPSARKAWYPGTPMGTEPPGLVQVTNSGKLRVLNPETGRVSSRKQALGTGYGRKYLAFGDRLFVYTTSTGAQIQMYDVAKDTAPKVLRTEESGYSIEEVAPCGKTRLCVLESKSSSQIRLAVVDTEQSKPLWTRSVQGGESVVPVGDNVLVVSCSSGETSLFDGSGKQLLSGERSSYTGARITEGSLLLMSGLMSGSSVSDVKFYGMNVDSDRPTDLGSIKVAGQRCSWNTKTVVCPSEKEFAAWRFGS